MADAKIPFDKPNSLGLFFDYAMPNPQRKTGLLLSGLPGIGALAAQGKGVARERQAGRQAAKEGRQTMSLYQRGKKKTYWFRFRFAGRIIHESTRSKSKTVARDAERERRRELERKWNRIQRRALPPTFESASRAWLEEARPHLSDRTQNIYDVALRCHLVPAFGAMLLSDIDRGEIARYQARRKASGAAARTVNKEIQVLRQILKRHKLWADMQGEVRFEREPASIGKALTREEESRLLEACQSNLLLSTAVILALHTALRKDEIRTLRWNQIDLFRRTLTVGRSKTEGSSGRLVPLNSTAYNALVTWARQFPEPLPQHYVFPACESARLDRHALAPGSFDPTQPIRSWRTAWRTAICRAGLQLRFHDLRHACITKLAEGQASEQTIMAIAGHLSRVMLEHYSHIRLQAKRVALDAIAGAPEMAILDTGVHQNVHQLPAGISTEEANSLN